MIIHNNLSQLYRMSGDPSKHKESLQDLLSSLMVLIERRTRDHDGSVSYGNDNINYWWDSNRWAFFQNGEHSEVVEGVLGNLDPLILREHCADAA
jgi:hypothetical protein